jgi:pyruvate/2-oxoglutarate dehydrogenase complex dihydrolipoamide dehydrogenase (E3) component
MLMETPLPLDLDEVLAAAEAGFAPGVLTNAERRPASAEFLRERLRHFLREAGHEQNAVDAVLALAPTRIDQVPARLAAVKAFAALPEAQRYAFTVWGLRELPQRLLVLGGGPIGCELAQAYARLGSQVVQVEMAARVLGREDPEVSELVAQALRADGVELRTGHRALRVEPAEDGQRLVLEHEGRECAVVFDRLLCAVGRTPRTRGYGLEELGIALTPRGTIQTDAHLRTTYPNIYAVGDVAGPWQLTHAAAHQAWYAAVNALFGRLRSFRVDERVMPWATFTDPEVARVGLSETEARERGVPFEVTRYDLDGIRDESTREQILGSVAKRSAIVLGWSENGEHACVSINLLGQMPDRITEIQVTGETGKE